MGRNGTGLGLTIVWNTVQDHCGGGTLESNHSGTATKDELPASPGCIKIEDLRDNGE